jgi:hypothetical protein
MSKRDAGGTCLEWAYGENVVYASDGRGLPNVPYVANVPQGEEVIAVSFADGVVGKAYHDGALIGDLSQTSVIIADDADVFIGNVFFGGARSILSHIYVAAIFPSFLTPQQHSDLAAAFSHVSINTAEPQLTSACPLQIVNPLVHLEGEVIAGEAIDKSSNGYHVSKQHAVEMESDCPVGTGFEAHGAARGDAYMDITDTGLDDHAAKTFAFWLRRNGSQELGAGRVFEKDISNITCYLDNSGNLVFVEAWSGGSAGWYVSGVIPAGQWVHVVIRHDGVAGTVPKIAINGTDTTVNTSTASSGTRISDVGPFYLFDRSLFNREMDGVIADFQWYSRYLTDAETESLYLRAALRSLDRGYSHIYPDSLVNKTAGEVGPYSILSGTHSWGDNVLTCVSAGGVIMPSKQAYGAWYFKFNKFADGDTIIIAFIASEEQLPSGGMQDGYELRITNGEAVNAYRITNGSTVVTIFNTANSYISINTDYEIFLSRSGSGLLTGYIRGGAYTSWTTVGSGTDTQWNTATRFSCDIDASDKLWDLLFFPYGGGLTPNDVPWLAD